MLRWYNAVGKHQDLRGSEAWLQVSPSASTIWQVKVRVSDTRETYGKVHCYVYPLVGPEGQDGPPCWILAEWLRWQNALVCTS